jgi:pimeloyl-ACP methyl ester carboxylesterase
MGLASDISEYGWLIEALSKDHRVIAFDNRGAGKTDKPDRTYTIEMMADDSAELLKTLEIKSSAVVGISMGGRIAMELTVKYPKLVSKLVLVSTTAKLKRTWRSYVAFNIITRLPLLKGKQPGYAFNRQVNASTNYDFSNRLSEINVPTLIMNGEKDGLVNYKSALELNDKINNSKLLSFRGGHMFFMWRERQEFISALSDYLTS